MLEVRGRRSGEPRRTPVNLLTLDDRQYLVSPRGEGQWVRNARAADGRVATILGRRREEWVAHELEGADKIPVLRAYLARWKAEVGVFFDGVSADSTDDELSAIAPRHPVFLLERAEAAGDGRRRAASRRRATERSRPAGAAPGRDGPAGPDAAAGPHGPAGRRRPPAAPRSGRVDDVVAAARGVLDRDGPLGLTMRSVADELGIKAPSLYKHVTGKAAIEVELVAVALTEMGRTLHATLAEGGTTATVLATYRRQARAQPNMYRLATTGSLPPTSYRPVSRTGRASRSSP